MRSERYGEEVKFGEGNVSILSTLEEYPSLLKRRGIEKREEGIINKGIGGGRTGNRRIRMDIVKGEKSLNSRDKEEGVEFRRRENERRKLVQILLGGDKKCKTF